MSKLQKGQAYPLGESRVLKTKRDHFGNKYEFMGAWFQPWIDDEVRVIGVDDDGIWCRREYKVSKLPKWLKRGIKNIGEMQTQA